MLRLYNFIYCVPMRAFYSFFFLFKIKKNFSFLFLRFSAIKVSKYMLLFKLQFLCFINRSIYAYVIIIVYSRISKKKKNLNDISSTSLSMMIYKWRQKWYVVIFVLFFCLMKYYLVLFIHSNFDSMNEPLHVIDNTYEKFIRECSWMCS